MHRHARLTALALTLALAALTGCDSDPTAEAGIEGSWQVLDVSPTWYWFIGADRVVTYMREASADCWNRSAGWQRGPQDGEWYMLMGAGNSGARVRLDGDRLFYEYLIAGGTGYAERIDASEAELTLCTAP